LPVVFLLAWEIEIEEDYSVSRRRAEEVELVFALVEKLSIESSFDNISEFFPSDLPSRFDKLLSDPNLVFDSRIFCLSMVSKS